MTGATGVIGRALMQRLRAEQLPFFIYSREMFDLSDEVPLFSIVPAKPSAIIHLAAAVPKPPEIPDDDSNAVITRKLDRLILKAAEQWDCHIVYASGCSLYKKNKAGTKIEEDTYNIVPQESPYLTSKQKGEADFLKFGKVTVLRISAPIGEGLSKFTALGRFIKLAREDGCLEIWGSGTREQNYVDVTDIADAFIRTLIMRPTEIINIAHDEPITMLKLANEVVRVFGRGSVCLTNKHDPHDGELARYSNLKAAELLGWRPVTDIKSSLESIKRFL
ncbi:MAG: NAD(P)-dependent oxidoreductase [Gammaproteobacteria bacterium]